MNRGSVPQYLPEAAVAFEKALERNPDQPNANFYLATVYYELGQFNKAIDHYRKELLLNPDHVAAMSDFGICLYMRKDPFRAAQIWEKALKIDDTPFLRFNPGKLYREMGQTEAAAIHLRYFVQIADRNYSQQKRLALQWLSNP